VAGAEDQARAQGGEGEFWSTTARQQVVVGGIQVSAELWTVLVLLPGGIFTGALSLLAWERVWLWRRMTVEQYAVDFRRLLRRADPAMPILLLVSGIGAVGLATETEGTKQTLLLAAVVCQLAIMVGSLALAEPINSKFRRLPEDVVPDGVAALRTRWRRLHLARTALALGAYSCIVVAVAQS
jgi:hypothetical protein